MMKNELAKRIAECDKACWTSGSSPVSDAEYDLLKAEFLTLGGTETLHAPDIRTVRKVRHAVPMLAASKVFAGEDVVAWAKRTGGGIEAMPKFDGAAVVKCPDGAVAARGDCFTGDAVCLFRHSNRRRPALVKR